MEKFEQLIDSIDSGDLDISKEMSVQINDEMLKQVDVVFCTKMLFFENGSLINILKYIEISSV